MRKNIFGMFMFASFFFFVAIGTVCAGERNNSKVIVETLFTDIDSLQEEVNHLRVIVAAVKTKETVPEEIKDFLEGVPQQLDVIASGLKVMRKEAKDDSIRLVNDQSPHEQFKDASRIISEIEGSLQRIMEELQEISNLYVI
ncbi:MAG: hypothetical protein AAB497_02460 [Patescibacteria group bacterium]